MDFECYRIEEESPERFVARRVRASFSDLPAGEVLIRVRYTSLNYKDVLSWTGNKGITRRYPHTPGIDAAGVVERSDSAEFSPGDEVIVTGFDLGMNTWGGFSEYVRVPASWVVRLPSGLDLVEAMTFGTAGFTAGQCVLRFQDNGCFPGKGPVLVTGATGGVGSVAVCLLAHLGYEVVAATRSPENVEFLRALGAHEIVSSSELVDASDRPLLKARWAGVVETVGGKLLETAIRSTERRAVITFCGMIGGARLETSVFPFILRGLRLIGVDSAECPLDQKVDLWCKLAGGWKPSTLSMLRDPREFDELPALVERMRSGATRGRVVVRVP
jgi:alcohol dehydrogenase